MRDIKKLKERVRTIISLHESRDFDALSGYVSPKEIEAATWFTKKRFFEVCEAIDNETGNITSLEYIDTLDRKSSYLTLWKTTYRKCSDEVLWQIIFDTASNKIKLMHINWEHVQ